MLSWSKDCLSSSGVDPIPLEGHLTLNSTAACVHRRSNFYAAIVGMGKNRRGLEIYGRETSSSGKLDCSALAQLGWLSDSNNYGEYVRNCSIFLVPADEQGVVKYANAGCAFPGWHWSHWWERELSAHVLLLRYYIGRVQLVCSSLVRNSSKATVIWQRRIGWPVVHRFPIETECLATISSSGMLLSVVQSIASITVWQC